MKSILIVYVVQNYSKSGRYTRESPTDCSVRRGGRGLPGSVVAVEGDAGEVFGAVGEPVEGDAQRGGAGGREDV